LSLQSLNVNVFVHVQVNSFNDDMIEQHIASLRVSQAITPAKIKQRMMPLLLKQLKSEYGWIFEVRPLSPPPPPLPPSPPLPSLPSHPPLPSQEPVDPIKLQLPDYFDVIKSPMDLGTVRKRLDGGTYYDTLDKVAADVKLTFDNAMLYNPPGQEIHKVGHEPLTGQQKKGRTRPVYHPLPSSLSCSSFPPF
jgi:hypothetical protein